MESAVRKLKDWRGERSTRVAARALGISQATYVQLESGKAKRVSANVALKIERRTDGAVCVVDWVDADDLHTGTHG